MAHPDHGVPAAQHREDLRPRALPAPGRGQGREGRVGIDEEGPANALEELRPGVAEAGHPGRAVTLGHGVHDRPAAMAPARRHDARSVRPALAAQPVQHRVEVRRPLGSAQGRAGADQQAAIHPRHPARPEAVDDHHREPGLHRLRGVGLLERLGPGAAVQLHRHGKRPRAERLADRETGRDSLCVAGDGGGEGCHGGQHVSACSHGQACWCWLLGPACFDMRLTALLSMTMVGALLSSHPEQARRAVSKDARRPSAGTPARR